MFTASNLA